MILKDLKNNYKYNILIILSLLYVLIYFLRTSFSPIAPAFMKEMNISASEMGIISSTYFLLYAIMQPIVGFLTDKFGARKVILVSFITTCLGCFAFGYTHDFSTAFLARMLIGISSAGVFVPGIKLLADWFIPEQFARVNGIYIGFGCVGALLSTVPLSYIELCFGWRSVFIGFALLGVFISLIVFMFLKDNVNNILQPINKTLSRTDYFNIVKNLFLSKNFIMLEIIIFISTGISITFQGLWATKYLVTCLSITSQFANIIILFIPLGSIFGAPLGGYLSDKVFYSRTIPLRIVLVTQLIIWSCIGLFVSSVNLFVLSAMFFILGMCISIVPTIIFTVVRDISEPETIGISMGLINPAVFLGIFFFQLTSGFLLDLTSINKIYTPFSYHNMILLFVISILLSIVLSFFVKDTQLKKQQFDPGVLI